MAHLVTLTRLVTLVVLTLKFMLILQNIKEYYSEEYYFIML